MDRKIFINLPVTDLDRAIGFYEAMGFSKNPQFSDETAACMVWSEAIYVMVLTHAKWRTFTQRPIPDSGSSEVMNCLLLESGEEVDAMAEKATPGGGTTDIQPGENHGFMMSRTVADPDGHIWELMWMDPAAAAPATEAAASA
jgi:uncharacterized protein